MLSIVDAWKIIEGHLVSAFIGNAYDASSQIQSNQITFIGLVSRENYYRRPRIIKPKAAIVRPAEIWMSPRM